MSCEATMTLYQVERKLKNPTCTRDTTTTEIDRSWIFYKCRITPRYIVVKERGILQNCVPFVKGGVVGLMRKPVGTILKVVL
jgi:hypothetical protein